VASGKADASILHELLTFVQDGAGTAGVEMAGTMAEMARMALAEDFRHIDPRSAHILLFEAASRILPTYPERLSGKARRHFPGTKAMTIAAARFGLICSADVESEYV
jgi:NADH:ubiquinone reductase (H+-translocating)